MRRRAGGGGARRAELLARSSGVSSPGAAAAWRSAPARSSSSARSGVRTSRWWSAVDQSRLRTSQAAISCWPKWVAACSAVSRGAAKGKVRLLRRRRGAGRRRGGPPCRRCPSAKGPFGWGRRVHGPIHVGVCSEQQRDDVCVAVLTREEERRRPLPRQVHVGARGEQQRDDVCVAARGGSGKRREAAVVFRRGGGVHEMCDRKRRRFCEQPRHVGGAAMPRGVDELPDLLLRRRAVEGIPQLADLARGEIGLALLLRLLVDESSVAPHKHDRRAPSSAAPCP